MVQHWFTLVSILFQLCFTVGALAAYRWPTVGFTIGSHLVYVRATNGATLVRLQRMADSPLVCTFGLPLVHICLT